MGRKSRFTEAQRKWWQNKYGIYFQNKNGTGNAQMPEEEYASFDEYYTKYLELEKLKNEIIEKFSDC